MLARAGGLQEIRAALPFLQRVRRRRTSRGYVAFTALSPLRHRLKRPPALA